MEVTPGLEPRTQGFAGLRLPIWPCYHMRSFVTYKLFIGFLPFSLDRSALLVALFRKYIGRDARLPIRLSSWIQQISDPCSFTIRTLLSTIPNVLWCEARDLNPESPACKAGAFTSCANLAYGARCET